jgi:hypothetical protein
VKHGDLVLVEVGGYTNYSVPAWRTVPTKYMQFSNVKDSLFRIPDNTIGMYIESSKLGKDVFHLVLFSSHGLGWIHEGRLVKIA